MPARRPSIPAAFFGVVLGLVGLGNGWRLASRIWEGSVLDRRDCHAARRGRLGALNCSVFVQMDMGTRRRFKGVPGSGFVLLRRDCAGLDRSHCHCYTALCIPLCCIAGSLGDRRTAGVCCVPNRSPMERRAGCNDDDTRPVFAHDRRKLCQCHRPVLLRASGLGHTLLRRRPDFMAGDRIGPPASVVCC